MTKQKLFRTIASFILCAAMTLCAALPAFAYEFEIIGCAEGIVAGDANGNGSVNIVDAIVVARFVAGFEETLDEVCADAYNDDVINMIDAIQIAKAMAGFPEIRLGHMDKTNLFKEPSCALGMGEVMCSVCLTSDIYFVPAVNDDHRFGGLSCIDCGEINPAVMNGSLEMSEPLLTLKEYAAENDYYGGELAPDNYYAVVFSETSEDYTSGKYVDVLYENIDSVGETVYLDYSSFSVDHYIQYVLGFDADTGLAGITVIIYDENDPEITLIVGGLIEDGELTLTAGNESYTDAADVESWERAMTAAELAEVQPYVRDAVSATLSDLDSILTEATGVSLAELGLS